jgi:tRNA threonylcarbamoyladenosine modification (KEOPS) complex  Pcc1 subunit
MSPASASNASPWDAVVRLGPYPEGRAERVLRALRPEAGREVPHTVVEVVAVPGDRVELRIRAETTSVLRAALNAYLRWADLAERTDTLAERHRSG